MTTTEPIVIRPAKPEDVPGVRTLCQEIDAMHYHARPDFFAQNPSTEQNEDVENRINTASLFLVAVNAPNIVGILEAYIRIPLAELVQNKVLWITNICVKQTKKRSGIGTALLDEAKAFADAQNCQRIELNVWAFNEGAYAFYLQESFTPQRTIMEFFIQQ